MFEDRRFTFTHHARNRLRRVKITEDEATGLARRSDTVQRTGNRINAWTLWNDALLRFVLVEEDDGIVVVTVIWPARPPREQAL